MNESTKPSLFVICPIGNAGSPERVRSDRVLKHLIEKAFPDFEVTRADRMTDPGRISDGIVTAIRDATLVVVDMTDHNANVFYEMAIAHGLRKPFVQIIELGNEIPFDLKDIRTIFYDTADPDKLEADRQLIRQYGEKAMVNPAGISTPISSVIPFHYVPKPEPAYVPPADMPDTDAWKQSRLTQAPDVYVRKLRALHDPREWVINAGIEALDSPYLSNDDRPLVEAAIESVGQDPFMANHPTLSPFLWDAVRRVRLAKFEAEEKQRVDSGPADA